MVAQVAVGKTPRQETEHQERSSSACTATSAKRKTAGPLSIDLDRIIDPVERVFAQRNPG